MVDLNMLVLQNFTFKQVIGEHPPANSELRKKIEDQMTSLIKNLQTKNKSELQEILSDQLKIKRELDRLAGAMALDQPKIELFHEFITKYIREIESRLSLI
jgi:hypothetical protein